MKASMKETILGVAKTGRKTPQKSMGPKRSCGTTSSHMSLMSSGQVQTGGKNHY
jgi:hypothetical protein